MKTAEEWMQDIPFLGNLKWTPQTIGEGIRQIQLDAVKHGMTLAADLIGDVTLVRNHGHILPFRDVVDDYESVRQAILTARDNKKSL